MSKHLKQIKSKLHRLRSQQNDMRNKLSPQCYRNQNNFVINCEQKNSKCLKSVVKYKKYIQKKQSSDIQEKYRILLQQNQELKKQILQLKVSQFYQFDNKKLKQLIKEVQKLKKSLIQCEQELKKTLSQNQELKNENQLLYQQIKFNKNQKILSKYSEQTNKTLTKNRKPSKQDEQLTLGVIQKPILKCSQNFNNFQEYRILLETETQSNEKRQFQQISNKIQSQSQTILQQTKLTKKYSASPKFGHKQSQQVLVDLQYLNYKSKRKSNILSKNQQQIQNKIIYL